MTGRPEPGALFPSFFMGGFECSTHRHREGRRIDVIDATRHDLYAAQDYARLRALGLLTARDGLRWHLIEPEPGEFTFTSARRQVRAARAQGVTVIWDLLHYGTPDHIDVLSPDFPGRFAAFVRAAAAFLRAETDGVLWLCPINEISFFAWGGGDVAYLNPFLHGRGPELKRSLVRAALAGMAAARAVDPQVRFLHAEPRIQVHAHAAQPGGVGVALGANESQFETFDLLAGRAEPELGGSPGALDVLGLNYYPYNQWRPQTGPAPHEVIGPSHAAYRPLRELLAETYGRYRRPLLIAETGTENEWRAPWLEMVAREAQAARAAGVPVEGVCLYPVVNHPGWDDDRHVYNGLWDYPDAQGYRAADPALLAALGRAQTDLMTPLGPAHTAPGVTFPAR